MPERNERAYEVIKDVKVSLKATDTRQLSNNAKYSGN